MKVKASDIFRDTIGCGLSFTQPFGAGEIGGYYNGTLVYTNLNTQVQVNHFYGDWVTSDTLDTIIYNGVQGSGDIFGLHEKGENE